MISITGLTVDLGGRRVLDQVALAVAAGESVALVGPNGSGKSTVLRCLLGLLPFRGQASVGGHDAQLAGVAARALLAYLPQRPAFGEADAARALGFLARLRGLDPAGIPAVLARVGLGDRADQPVSTFSGGMQQRLALAAAIHAEAPVVLLDEPSASLDREGQAIFREVAGAWRAAGRTLLLASHRAEEVAHLCDRTVELEDGRVAGAPPARIVPIQRARGTR